MATKEKCVSCNKVCSKDLLHCRACDGCCHLKCANISEATFKEIQPLHNFTWNCDECIKRYDGNMIGSLMEKIAAMGRDMGGLMNDNLKAIEGINDTLNDKLNRNDLKDSVTHLEKELKRSWAEVVKEEVKINIEKMEAGVKKVNCGFEQGIDEKLASLKKEVICTRDKMQEWNEKADRANNIIVFNLKESDKTRYDDCRKDDFERIINIVDVIGSGKIIKEDIVQIFRLGKKETNNRPVLIKFKSKMVKNLFMENLNKIQTLGENLRNIRVGHDLTKEQRIDCKKLADSARDMEAKELGDFIYRVRGEPGNFRVVKLKKRQI